MSSLRFDKALLVLSSFRPCNKNKNQGFCFLLLSFATFAFRPTLLIASSLLYALLFFMASLFSLTPLQTLMTSKPSSSSNSFSAHPFHDVLVALDRSSKASPPRHQKWLTRSLLSSGRCAFCSCPIDPEVKQSFGIAYLVPVSLGGPEFAGNRALACRRCLRSLAGRDVLTWPGLALLGEVERGRIISARAAMLLHASNHLTPLSPHASKEAVVGHLTLRHSQPRFRVFAHCGSKGTAFIGWSRCVAAHDQLEALAGALVWGFGARPVPDTGELTLFAMPATGFLDAVWEAIELGGLVLPLFPDDVAPRFDLDDWRWCWHVTHNNLTDLRLRRGPAGQRVMRLPYPKTASSTSNAAAMKRKRQRRKQQVNELAYQAEQADLDRMLGELANGELVMSAGDVAKRQLEVLRLRGIVLGL